MLTGFSPQTVPYTEFLRACVFAVQKIKESRYVSLGSGALALDYCFSESDGPAVKPFHSLSVAGQLVAHIRQSISTGDLSGTMPGIRKLANELGVSSNTVVAAIEQLEREGFVKPEGQGRRSRIVLPEDHAKPGFRVTLLPYERADIQLDYVVEIQRRLKEEGHDVHVTNKSLMDMRLNVGQIARMARKTETDAWVVLSSTQEILEWFAGQSKPTFALFGRFRQLPLAGAGLDKVPAVRAAVRRLAELGHQRIVLLQPKHNREPVYSRLIRETLAEMELHGIKTGQYNVPTGNRALRGCGSGWTRFSR